MINYQKVFSNLMIKYLSNLFQGVEICKNVGQWGGNECVVLQS